MAFWAGIPGVGCSWQAPTDEGDLPGKALSCHAKSDHFERKLSPRFKLPDQLLRSANESSAIGSILLSLPYEVILEVFDSVDHAPSQIALALTCKKLATVAADVNLALSTTSRKYAGFLPKTVFDVPELMMQLKPWMPPDLRLCNHCLTNRPFREDYWSGIAGCQVSNFWIQKTGWKFADASWHKQVHDICPACHGSCSLSDYVDCDGCRALGRLGDVDWSRVSDSWRKRTEEELRAGRFAT